MTEAMIRTVAEAATDAVFDPNRGIHTNVVGTGEHLQLIWARYEPGASYTLHTRRHEQFQRPAARAAAAHGRRRKSGTSARATCGTHPRTWPTAA